jgi:alpha-beta hydrolase superfamily lysophospholipase
MDAVHIIAKDNHFFESPELETIIALVSPLAEHYDGVLGFGSSMGSIGAMHFAARMGAQIVIAMSPLFDVRPQHPPFDQRRASDTTDFPARRSSESKFPPAAIVLYDPSNHDRKHVRMYREHCFIQELRMPFAGHLITRVAHDSGRRPQGHEPVRSR